jgi:mutator protein MutT
MMYFPEYFLTKKNAKNPGKSTSKRRIDVAIAVISGDRGVLICQRRRNDSFGGYWEFPGGKRDPGESLHDCLHRELREELAIAVRITESLTKIAHNYPHIHLTLHPFLCQHISGAPKALESDRFKWIKPAQLRRHRFPPANKALLDEVVQRFAEMPV